MQYQNRSHFSIEQSARIRGGRIIALHDHGCGALGGNACTCTPFYRVVRDGRRGR